MGVGKEEVATSADPWRMLTSQDEGSDISERLVVG